MCINIKWFSIRETEVIAWKLNAGEHTDIQKRGTWFWDHGVVPLHFLITRTLVTIRYCIVFFFSGVQRRNLQVKFFRLKHMLILIHRQLQLRFLWVQYLSGLYMLNSNLSRNWCVSFYIPSPGKGGHWALLMSVCLYVHLHLVSTQ
jgi:hypothetical protein